MVWFVAALVAAAALFAGSRRSETPLLSPTPLPDQLPEADKLRFRTAERDLDARHDAEVSAAKQQIVAAATRAANNVELDWRSPAPFAVIALAALLIPLPLPRDIPSGIFRVPVAAAAAVAAAMVSRRRYAADQAAAYRSCEQAGTERILAPLRARQQTERHHLDRQREVRLVEVRTERLAAEARNQEEQRQVAEDAARLRREEEERHAAERLQAERMRTFGPIVKQALPWHYRSCPPAQLDSYAENHCDDIMARRTAIVGEHENPANPLFDEGRRWTIACWAVENMPAEIDAFLPEGEKHDRNPNHLAWLIWRLYSDQRLELLPRAEAIDRERRRANDHALEAARLERERAEADRPPPSPSLDPFADLPADLQHELNTAGVTQYFKAATMRDELARIAADFMNRYPSLLEQRGLAADQVDELREAMDFNIKEAIKRYANKRGLI